MTTLRSSLQIAGLGNLLDATDVDALQDGTHEVFLNKIAYEERRKEGSIIADATPQMRARVGNSDGGYSIYFPLQSYMKCTDANRIKAIAGGIKEEDLIEEGNYLCVITERDGDAVKAVQRIAEPADSDGMKFITRKLKGFFIGALSAEEEELVPQENEDFVDVFMRIAERTKEQKMRFFVKLYKDKQGKIAYEKAWAKRVTIPATEAAVESEDIA